jgi:UDP-N-acetylmuramoylalanine--D-glutamate ligase
VVGVDDDLCLEMAAQMPGAVRISGYKPADFWADGTVLRDGTGPMVDLRAAPALPGAHNGQNAAAAAAMATYLGIEREAIADGIKTFPGLAHRQELVATIDGIRFVNDSKATNADAAARALNCYGRIVWIAGGIAKEGGIEPLAPYFPKITQALLIGRDAEAFAATLAAHNVPVEIVETLDRAVPEAFAAARKTGADVVLLSPACASFDQFFGFEDRGKHFSSLVRALEGGA